MYKSRNVRVQYEHVFFQRYTYVRYVHFVSRVGIFTELCRLYADHPHHHH